MKKVLIYATILLVVAIISVSGTYAFFYAFVSNQNALNNIGGHQIQVIYSGDTEISGEIELVETKEEGFRRVVSIALGEDSVPVVGNLYIHLSNISSGLASKALKWELYEINGETEKYVSSGTFEGYSSSQRIYMVKDLELTQTTRDFAIYIWLNGHEAGNEVIGSSLMGYIGAESNQVSGITTE